jgi:hypothetical protein
MFVYALDIVYETMPSLLQSPNILSTPPPQVVRQHKTDHVVSLADWKIARFAAAAEGMNALVVSFFATVAGSGSNKVSMKAASTKLSIALAINPINCTDWNAPSDPFVRRTTAR